MISGFLSVLRGTPLTDQFLLQELGKGLQLINVLLVQLFPWARYSLHLTSVLLSIIRSSNASVT